MTVKADIKSVIFDLDGTLTDTEKYYQTAWPEACRRFGFVMEPWMPLELRSLGRPYAPVQFKEWFGDTFDYDAVREERKKIVKELIKDNGIPLKPGALEILSWLRANGITVAMATANDLKRTMGYLEQIGLAGAFDKVICADMVEFGKPAPDIYSYTCRELGVDPAEAFAIEDSPNGVTSAYKAGCKVIMVPDLTEPDEDLKKMLYARCDTLMGIRDLIAN